MHMKTLTIPNKLGTILSEFFCFRMQDYFKKDLVCSRVFFYCLMFSIKKLSPKCYLHFLVKKIIMTYIMLIIIFFCLKCQGDFLHI